MEFFPGADKEMERFSDANKGTFLLRVVQRCLNAAL
jgi:hypothetical protein